MGEELDEENEVCENAVKVYLRFRPSVLDDQSCKDCFQVHDGRELIVESPLESYAFRTSQRTNSDHGHRFSFTSVFEEETNQRRVYEESIQGSVCGFLEGQNCLNFTYGVTNSGKTYTLVGDTEQPGLLQNAISTLFSRIDDRLVAFVPHYTPEFYDGVSHTSSATIQRMEITKKELMALKSGGVSVEARFSERPLQEEQHKGPPIDENVPTTYYIYMSIAEIYNEKIFDLLNVRLVERLKRMMKKSPLSIGTDTHGFSYIKDLTYVLVKNVEEAMAILNAGTLQRQVAMTKLNMQSSRSHVIYSVKLIKVHHLPHEIITSNHDMSFVDLAGSERPSKAQSEGARFKEASNINLSLLVLGKCIEVLRHNRKTNACSVVPFRESKLTRLLQPFFVGRRSSINLFSSVSTDLGCFDETLNVLRFSSLTIEALARPLACSLTDPSVLGVGDDGVIATPHRRDTDLRGMSKNELIRRISALRKANEFLEAERHVIEAKIRQQCFEETDRMIKTVETKYKKHLLDTKTNIIHLYKNKLTRLEAYYKQLLEEKLVDASIDNNALLQSIECDLARKTSEAQQLQQEYHYKLQELENPDSNQERKSLFESEKNSLKLSIARLEEELATKQETINEHIVQLESLRDEKTALENELLDVKNQLIDKMAEMETRIEEQAKYTLEISTLRAIVDEKEKKISQLESMPIFDNPHVLKLQQEHDNLKLTLSTLELDLSKCTRKIERDQDRVKKLREEVDHKQEIIRKLRLENFNLKDEVSLVNAKIQNQNQPFSKSPRLDESSVVEFSTGQLHTPEFKTSTKHYNTPQKTPLNTSANTSPKSSHTHRSLRATPRDRTPKSTMIPSPAKSSCILKAAESACDCQSYRLLYEEAREYAMRMEERVKELQLISLPSAPTKRTSIKRNISQLKSSVIIDKEPQLLHDDDTNNNGPKNESDGSSLVHIKRMKTDLGPQLLTSLQEKQDNPSIVYRIESTDPDLRKIETQEYIKRLKLHPITSKESGEGVISKVKKKLNLLRGRPKHKEHVSCDLNCSSF